MSNMFVMEENLLCTPGIHHLAANRTTVARAFYGLGNAKLSRSVDCRSGIGGLGGSHPVRCCSQNTSGRNRRAGESRYQKNSDPFLTNGDRRLPKRLKGQF